MAAAPSGPLNPALSQVARDHLARGRRLSFGGHSVHVFDGAPAGAEAASTAYVLVHGFPESSVDLVQVIARLLPVGRVIAMDLLGFGFSDKPYPHAYSLFEQADVVDVVLRACGVKRAQLLAHDMGTSVATELLARRRLGILGFEVGSLVLTNGSVYIDMASLTPSQKLLRLPVLGGLFSRVASWTVFRAQVRRLLGRPVPDEALRDMFELMVADGGRRVMPSIIGYVDERRRFADRWHTVLRSLDVPVKIVWGQKDSVAVPAIGERLAAEIPGALIERLHDVGHFTPLEAPDELASALQAVALAAG